MTNPTNECGRKIKLGYDDNSTDTFFCHRLKSPTHIFCDACEAEIQQQRALEIEAEYVTCSHCD